MKLNHTSPIRSDEVARARRQIENDFVKLRLSEPRISRLALNEAEAIAWQSGWSGLVFPVLAEEKLRAVSAWRRNQKALRNLGGGVN